MKKLLMSSIVLFLFSASIVMFQMSCTKTMTAQTSTTSPGVVVYQKINASNLGVIYKMNQDGTGKTEIKITLPSGQLLYFSSVLVSNDGKTLFFTASDYNSNSYLYSANIDGTNPKLLDTANNINITLGGCN